MLAKAKPPFAQPTDRLFPSTPILRTLRGGYQKTNGKRRYVKGDLDRAGIPFEDDQGRTVDRHAFRTTFISWLGQHGVDPRAPVILARHAPRGVTLKHYQDFKVFDLWKEIRKLPGINQNRSLPLAATGTDGPQGRVLYQVLYRRVAFHSINRLLLALKPKILPMIEMT